MVGDRFDEVLAAKLPVDRWLPMTRPEEPNLKSPLPLSVCSRLGSGDMSHS
jgi:hypothetical protein